MNVKTVELVEDITELKSVWNSTVNQSGADSVFVTYEWLTCWLNVYAAGVKQFILCVKENESVIALAPLIILPVKILGISMRKLQFIGHGSSDYMDFIIVRENVECLELLFDFLQKQKCKWECCELHNISQESVNFPLYNGILSHKKGSYKIFRENICPYVTIETDIDTLLKTRKAGLRYDLKNGELQLRKEGNLKYEKITDQEIALKELPKFFEMAERREITVKRTTTNQNLENRRKIFEMYVCNNQLWQNMNFCRISLDDRVIAYHFGFEYNRKLYWYKPTFDIEYSKYSLGKLLIKWTLMYAIDQNYREFDFLIGEEPYKFQWTALSRGSYCVFISNEKIISRILYFWILLLEPKTTKIKQAVKKHIMRLVK